MSKSALVFGASGISGWAFINEILHDYPSPNTWKRAHALTNRPLTLEKSQWPNDSRLNIVSGVDLLFPSQEDVVKELSEQIPDIKEVTHVYYVAYKGGRDLDQELSDAAEMFKKAVIAVDKLCPKLEVITLQLGTKIYGCYPMAFVPGYIQQPDLKPPHFESQPRLRGEWGDKLFYHAQVDFIAAYANGKSWSWFETRPDIIVGFVPNQNFYSMATDMGIYLSLWREMYGEASECPFPGTEECWNVLSNDSSSDMIARQTIHLSLCETTERGTGYNVADSKTPSRWSSRWPIVCDLFNLKGIGPSPDSPDMKSFIKDNIKTWEHLEAREGLQKGHAKNPISLAGLMLTKFNFDRHFDMSKMYSTGFQEERSTKESWGGAFERMRKAKIIP